MKKLVLLFLSILSIVIIGCKVDNILGISKNYEGTWVCTEGELNGKTVTINSDGSLKYNNITIPLFLQPLLQNIAMTIILQAQHLLVKLSQLILCLQVILQQLFRQTEKAEFLQSNKCKLYRVII